MILTTSGLGPHEVTAAPVGDDLLSFTLNVSRILLVITICPLSTRATIDGRYRVGHNYSPRPSQGGSVCRAAASAAARSRSLTLQFTHS